MALSLSGKYNIGVFQYDGDSYRTDKPWDIGVGLRYKSLAATVFLPLSANNDAFDVAFNFYLKKMYFETFIKRYTNFYPGEQDHADRAIRENVGLDVMNTGLFVGWVADETRHSLRSLFSLSEEQRSSSGSFLYGFGVCFTSLYSENPAMPRYAERHSIVYFGPTGGYSYTWVFPHRLFLNLGATVGANAGIKASDGGFLFIPQVNPKITFGHHDDSWSVNAVMGCNTSMLFWGDGDFDTLAPATMSVTFSRRL
jgi:hypothetical protein